MNTEQKQDASTPDRPAALPLAEYLLRALLTTAPLAEIAERAGITLLDLIAWFEDPQTQQRLAALRRILEIRAQLIADDARPSALDALAGLLEHTEDPIELRRVAATLARETRPHAAGARKQAETLPDQDLAPAPTPAPDAARTDAEPVNAENTPTEHPTPTASDVPFPDPFPSPVPSTLGASAPARLHARAGAVAA